MTPSLPADGPERYDRWRRQWRANIDSQAIAILRHHGLARTLQLTASLPPASEPSPGSPPMADPVPILREAASMLRNLLAHEYAAEGTRHV